MLTGKRPFEGDHITTVVYKIIHEAPPDLHTCKQGLPPGFGAIINKALAKDPNCRYQTCKELAADLALLDQNGEATMRLPGISSPLIPKKEGSKKSRRWKTVFIGAAAAFLLAAIGFYFFVLPGLKSQGGGELSPLPEVKIPTSKAQKKVLDDPVVLEIEKLERLFSEEKYEETIRVAQEEGLRYTDDERFQSYISRSESKLQERVIAEIMEAGDMDYKQGRYKQSIARMRDILQIDPRNAEAQKKMTLSLNAISRAEITRLIERHKSAEEGKDLLGLLNDYGVDPLIEIRKNEARNLFNLHDDIKSFVSNVSIVFSNTTHAEVDYQNLVSAVLKQTGQRKIIFEGTITWTVEKQADGWKIIDYKSRDL